MSDDSAREQIAAELIAKLPGYVIDNYPNNPAQVLRDKPYVDVYLSELDNLGANQIRHSMTVNVMAVAGTPEATERAIETARDNVLIVLSQMLGVFPEKAERQTFLEGTYAGYGITATAHSPNHYLKAEVTL